MPTSQATLAQMNRTAAASLAKVASGLGDQIEWRPLDKGRSALDQVQECGFMNLFVAQIFEAQAAPPFDRSEMMQIRAAHDTPEKALTFLDESTQRLARAIERFPAEKLNERLTLPFWGGVEKTFAEAALVTYWNMVYHEGQINYIQSLAAE